ncbi:hypothetical protein [Saliphagus sp. LR7]|uniref:hypothetical protein n=1 Tax=Saliphagus sp. LR7 TaxID=2282654 RepID=UPI001E2D57C7|nr:hypothetical protein [Saliphagus sp. LR7]
MASPPERARQPADAGRWRVVNRLLQAGIVAGLAAGIRRRDPSVVVNALLSLAFASLPAHVERWTDVSFRPWQRGWLSLAGLVHTLGMLGPYDHVWWWDDVAHTLSGGVVAGAADVLYRSDADGRYTDCTRPAFIAGVTLGFGVVWEGLEYLVHALGDRIGVEPMLVTYGWRDTLGDLVFDLLGAALVVRFGRVALSNLVGDGDR